MKLKCAKGKLGIKRTKSKCTERNTWKKINPNVLRGTLKKKSVCQGEHLKKKTKFKCAEGNT